MKQIVVNIVLPPSWQSLTEGQLRYLFFLFAEGYSLSAVKTFCLMRWGKLEVLHKLDEDTYRVRHEGTEFEIKTEGIAALLAPLDWVGRPPQTPVRPPRIGGRRALPADFAGVPFEQYLYLDNLFQGYLHTDRPALLAQMAELLYGAPGVKLAPAEAVGVFFWFASLKALFARKFPHFLRPAAAEGGNLLGRPLAAQLTEAMNAQLRALTKGDVTKEAEVRQLDTWRALTELDALAKENEELQRVYGKYK